MGNRSCLCPDGQTFDKKCCRGPKHPRAFKNICIGTLTGRVESSVRRYGREFSEDFSNDFK